MEPSALRSYHADLARHPLFKGLSPEEKTVLKRHYRIYRIPGDADFIYPGDGADSLYILLSGSVRRGHKRYYKGDFWGLETLIQPENSTETFCTGEESVLMRLRSENFRRMLKDHPGLARHFRPRKDGEEHLIRGIPDESWQSVKKLLSQQERKGTLLHYKCRRSRKYFSLSLLLPFMVALSGIFLSERYRYCIFLIPFGILIMGMQFFLRGLTLYKVSDKAVIKRFFNWRSLRQDQEVIPIDQIQSVVVSIRGLIPKLLKIGDLQVQAAGKGIVFREIDAPAQLQSRLMTLTRSAAAEEKGRDRETLREMISQRLTPESADELLYTGDLSSGEGEKMEEKHVFRKSPFILIFQLFFPCCLMAAGLVKLPHPWLILVYAIAGIGFLRALWVTVDWWNDIYMIHLPYVWDIERKPFGKEEIRKQTELRQIVNVTASQKGLLTLLLNYGNVRIETAGRGEPMIFYTVKKPFHVQNALLEFRDYSLRIQEKKRREQAREDLLEFTEVLDQARRRGTPLSNGTNRE